MPYAAFETLALKRLDTHGQQTVQVSHQQIGLRDFILYSHEL